MAGKGAAPFTLNAPTLLEQVASSANLTTYSNASFTPTANALVLVWVASSGGSADVSSVTGNGITYAEVTSIGSGVTNISVSLWAGSAASPSNGAISITFPAGRTGCNWRVEEWTGSVTPTVRQFKTDQEESASANTVGDVTLDALPQATSAVAAMFAKNSTGDFTAGTDFTPGLNSGHTTPVSRALTEYDIVPVDALADCSWATAAPWHGLAIEIGAP